MVHIRRLVPSRIKRLVSDSLGITALNKRIDLLYGLIESELSSEAKEDLWKRSRTRWRQSGPGNNLTWGLRVSGDSFISKVSSYHVFDFKKNILEVGAGYGRLLRSCLKQQVPFGKYVAIDISKENVRYLRKKFPGNKIHVVHGDAENCSFDTKFDVVLSSLTFKHLFPSFEKTLHNVANYVHPGGMFFFDLIEGNRRGFEDDGLTYFRWYERSEILEVLSNISIEFVAFDRVQHAPNFSRLLVIAKKPKA